LGEWILKIFRGGSTSKTALKRQPAGARGGLVICFRRYLPECLLAGVVVCRLRGKLGLVWWVS
jgi:hypothetical protein